MKYWEVIVEKLSAAGRSWGHCSAVTRNGEGFNRQTTPFESVPPQRTGLGSLYVRELVVRLFGISNPQLGQVGREYTGATSGAFLAFSLWL